MKLATTPRGVLAPDNPRFHTEKKPYVTDAHIGTVKQIIKKCVVKYFCANVVALRKKSEVNKSLLAAGIEVNIVEAMKSVSCTSSSFITELMKTHTPPAQFKEVRFHIISPYVVDIANINSRTE